MKREDFVKVAEEALDSLPEQFRSRIQNVAILVEDFPPNQSPRQPGQQRRLLLGIFHGVPATKKSVFDVSMGPAHIVLADSGGPPRSFLPLPLIAAGQPRLLRPN
jgi:predicted Zn-dependent protease with MMP-like domain